MTETTAKSQQLYTKLEKIGKGSYGEVFKGINNRTGEIIAIKVIHLESKDFVDADLSEIQKEVHLLSSMTGAAHGSASSSQPSGSEFVIKYRESVLVGMQLWIVMDFAGGGSVRSFLNMGGLHEKYIIQITYGICSALSFLHRIGIVHRDIKCANILITEEGCIKLCDFGVAGQISARHLKRFSFVGSPYWMPPEVIKRSAYNFKADIWSLGITVYEMAKTLPPYADVDPMKALFLIPRNPPAQLEGDFSRPLKDFVSSCLNDEPDLRPSADDLLKHKLLKSASRRKVTGLSSSMQSYSNQDLVELIQVYRKWKQENDDEEDYDEMFLRKEFGNDENDEAGDGNESWTFDTYKSISRQTSSASHTSKQLKQQSSKSLDRSQRQSLKQPISEEQFQTIVPLNFNKEQKDSNASSSFDNNTDEQIMKVKDIAEHSISMKSRIVSKQNTPDTETDASNLGNISIVDSLMTNSTDNSTLLDENSHMRSDSVVEKLEPISDDQDLLTKYDDDDLPLKTSLQIQRQYSADSDEIPISNLSFKQALADGDQTQRIIQMPDTTNIRLPSSLIDQEKQKSFSTGSPNPNMSNQVKRLRSQSKSKTSSKQNRIQSMQVNTNSPTESRRRASSSSSFVQNQILINDSDKQLLQQFQYPPPRVDLMQSNDIEKLSQIMNGTLDESEKLLQNLLEILEQKELTHQV